MNLNRVEINVNINNYKVMNELVHDFNVRYEN